MIRVKVYDILAKMVHLWHFGICPNYRKHAGISSFYILTISAPVVQACYSQMFYLWVRNANMFEQTEISSGILCWFI